MSIAILELNAGPVAHGADRHCVDIHNHWDCHIHTRVYCPGCIDEGRESFLLTDGHGRYHCAACQVTWERDALLATMSECLAYMANRNRRIRDEIMCFAERAKDQLGNISHEAERLHYCGFGWR